MGQRLVLVGAGHAHLETIARGAELARRGARLTLIAPHSFRYSGTASGELGGRYPVGFGRVDSGAIARHAGFEVLRMRASRVASVRRRVVLEDGREIEYDWLSLDVGSAPQRDQIPGVPHERVVPVKPVLKLLKLRERLCAPNPPKLIVVLGAGPSGCEVAANVKTCQPGAAVVIIDAAPHALPWAGPGALVQRILRGRGIAFVLGRRAQRAEGDALHLDDGSIVRFDLLVDATTPMPNRLAATAGLLLDERGAILVDGSSRAIEDPRVFAVGDSSARRGSPVARNGVHAVREGRMLFENLASVLEGRPPRPWSWPDRTLQILDLGDGTALAMRGSWYLRSAAMLWWKSWIDRRWLARWNSLPKAAELSATDSFA